ncbi:competence protein CoiA [Lacticaseibacillus zhaodongensis]|uniref:competence protein CoiA n=1 Tax=Lacticaseibacillus zhaodongensis TaxID=2668065 RepID=UPI0018AFAFD5|nr:competence protein CoiA family protein [Lacticaseibacillus zhaodongensis]
MFVALDQEGRRCELLSHEQAAGLKRAQAPVFCPACGERLLIRNGSQLPAHFAHRSHACNFGEPESSEHLRGKMLLRDIAVAGGWTAELEVYLPEQKQRIDVLITHGAQRRALEFQCSPLAAGRLRERTQGYASLGLPTQWLLGKRYFNDRAAAGRAKFAILGPRGLELRFLDSARGLLWRDTQLRRHGGQRQSLWPQLGQSYGWGRGVQPVTAARKLALALHYQQRPYLRLQNQCYPRRLNLAGCPWVVQHGLSDLPGLVLPEDLLRVQWLLQFSAVPRITVAANLAFWQQAIRTSALPLVNAQAYAELVAPQFCAELVRRGYLEWRADAWQWLQQPQWYPDLDTKLAQFNSF